MKPNPHIGSTLDDFLKEEGLFEDATTHAVKRLMGWQAKRGIQKKHKTPADGAPPADATTPAP